MARWLSGLMVQQAGLPVPKHPFEGRGSDQGEKEYLEAMKRGYLTDYDLLTEFFVEAMERRLRG